MKTTAFVFCFPLALFLEAVPANAGSYTFTQLLYGSDSAYPNSINDNGQIVGWYLEGGVGFTHGFLDNHGLYTTIDPPNVPIHADARLIDINNAGVIVGNVQAFGDSGMPTYEYGFLYSGGAFTIIGTPGSVSVNILGINNLGEILGEGGPCSCTFIYQGGVFTPVLGLPGRALGFNDSSQIVGFYDDAQGYRHGYLYTGGSYTTIGAQGAPVPNGTMLWDINDADQIVRTAYGLQPIGFAKWTSRNRRFGLANLPYTRAGLIRYRYHWCDFAGRIPAPFEKYLVNGAVFVDAACNQPTCLESCLRIPYGPDIRSIELIEGLLLDV